MMPRRLMGVLAFLMMAGCSARAPRAVPVKALWPEYGYIVERCQDCPPGALCWRVVKAEVTNGLFARDYYVTRKVCRVK